MSKIYSESLRFYTQPKIYGILLEKTNEGTGRLQNLSRPPKYLLTINLRSMSKNMKATNVQTVCFILLLLLIFSTTTNAYPTTVLGDHPAASIAKVWTDKSDYHPSETVTIYGSGFTPSAVVALTVTKLKDGTTTCWSTTSDAYGNFTTTYQIDQQGAPLYKVEATDGTHNATTTFTDSSLTVYDTSTGLQTTGNDIINGSLVGHAGDKLLISGSVSTFYTDWRIWLDNYTYDLYEEIASRNSGLPRDFMNIPYTIPQLHTGFWYIDLWVYNRTSGWISPNTLYIVFNVIPDTTPIPSVLGISGPSSVVMNTAGNAYSIQLKDKSGNPAGAISNVNVSLTATSGKWYNDIACTSPITYIMINSGSNTSATIYFKGTTITTTTLGASATGFTSASKSVSVTSANPTITFVTSGMTTDASGTVLTVDTVPYTQSQILAGLSFTWAPGTTHAIIANTPVDVSGGKKQYTFANWTNGNGLTASSDTFTTPSTNTTVTANYIIQYYLTVESSHSTPSGQGWYDAGTIAHASIADLTVSIDAKSQYTFSGWAGDASGSTSPSNGILMDGPKTATAMWQGKITTTDAYGSPVDVTVTGDILPTQILNLTFSVAENAANISMTVTGPSGAIGTSNMTIPRSSLPADITSMPVVYVDGDPASDQGYTQDALNYYIWYTMHFSTHEVQVSFQRGNVPMPTFGTTFSPTPKPSASPTLSPQPTTTPTPTPSPSPTIMPTPLPTPSQTPTPTQTPQPRTTPTLTPQQTAPPSPSPQQTPSATPTPAPTAHTSSPTPTSTSEANTNENPSWIYTIIGLVVVLAFLAGAFVWKRSRKS